MTASTLLLAYLVVLTVAETFRLRMRGRIETAPTALAVGFALAVSVKGPHDAIEVQTWQIALVVLASQVFAYPVTRIGRDRRRRLELVVDSALRLGTVVAISLIVRDLPLISGVSVSEASTTWMGWRRAIVLMSAIGFVLSLETPVRVWLRHRVWGRDRIVEPNEDLRMTLGLSVVLVASGAILALAQEALGLAALPFALVPLVVTQVAILHQARIQRAHRQSVRALSRMPEVAGLVPRGHAATVARLGVAVGQELALPTRDVAVLETAALLHDLGQVVLRRPIPGGATVLAASGDQEHLAQEGAAIVAHVGHLSAVSETIAAQATPYHHIVQRRARIPVQARILKVANAYIDYLGGALETADRAAHEEALERLYLGLGYEYDPKVVAALEKVLARGGFGAIPAADPAIGGAYGASAETGNKIGAGRVWAQWRAGSRGSSTKG